ncbi:MAG: hypothetical protein JWO08_3781 [Verrucomicrobiaceae bacterium]|nr:hypothetical protein [Verrucomicrobiaceae bacterium]
MKNPSSPRCLLAALLLLFVSGFSPAQGSVQERNDPSATRPSYAVEMNTTAYIEVIVIPLLLFILMIGVVRTQKV